MTPRTRPASSAAPTTSPSATTASTCTTGEPVRCSRGVTTVGRSSRSPPSRSISLASVWLQRSTEGATGVQKPFRRRFSTTTLPPSRVHLANLNQLRITVPFAMRTYPPGTKAGEYTSCPDPTVALLILGHDLMPQRNRRRATRVLRCLPQEPRGATRGRLLWAGPLLRAGGVEYPARPLQALRERTPSREDGRGRARTSAGGLREWVETTPLFKDSRKLVTKRKRVREREEEREVERKIERKRRGKKLWTSENDLDRKVL